MLFQTQTIIHQWNYLSRQYIPVLGAGPKSLQPADDMHVQLQPRAGVKVSVISHSSEETSNNSRIAFAR